MKMKPKCGLVLFIWLMIPHIESGYVKEREEKRLNQYISFYETLNYDANEVHASHSRAKRSVTKDHHINFKFRAYGDNFHLRLKRDLESFSDNLIVDSTNGPVSVDTSHIYRGRVVGDPESYAFGSIHDGVFEGKIVTSKDSYYVEKARHYFPNQSYVDKGFHSVIYKEEHVDDPYQHMRKGHSPGCGIDEEVSEWMERIQNSAVEDDSLPPQQKPSSSSSPSSELPPNSILDRISKKKISKTSKSKKYQSAQQLQPPLVYNNNEKARRNSNESNDDGNNNNDHVVHKQPAAAKPINDEFKFPYEKYTKEANVHQRDDESGNEWHTRTHERVKRATNRLRDEHRNTCSLYIQTDPLIWRHIREGVADQHRGKKSEVDEKTREEILSLIAHHVTAVNYIYRNTKFDGRKEHRNIKFEVQRIKIDDDSSCGEHYKDDPNPFCMENIDVSNFLNLHSLGNHEIFCLAYVFTYRDFTGGTLGLAWVASASGASGGICEKYKTYTETVGGLYQSTKRSLNTGIITFVNYNSRVPPKVSQLTLAHEIGHNFGSPHDYPAECRPGGVAGNYIMFASATSGDRPNNSKFSTCSVRNISNVLDAIEESKKRNCFQVSEGAFCGNKIVEAGEQCDCGFNKDECNDPCCYPRIIEESDLSINATAKGCTRRARTQCSPSQGPCCQSETCTFMPARNKVKCKEETECSWSSYCNGTSPECPEPTPRDNNTKCNNGTQVCIKGDCAGSICLLWNMTECFLTSQIIPHIDKRKLCELACQNGNDTTTCRSTSEFAQQYGLPVGGISLRPGSPCDNFQGYCDVFLKCRAVDAEGPLVRLKNLLLNKQTLQTVAHWVTENWYAVICMGILFVIFMGMFIKCCAVHTPSSNPKKPPARRISETLRHPMHTLRRMRRDGGPRNAQVPVQERRSRSGGGGGHSRDPQRMRDGGRDHQRPRDGRSAGSSRTAAGGVPGGRQPQGGHGYDENRSSQYYPKASAPPAPHYSRVNNELYSDAYPNINRPPYDIQQRHHNNKV